MMSYAEDETDVEGTVNGVTNTASGERWELAEGSWGGWWEEELKGSAAVSAAPGRAP